MVEITPNEIRLGGMFDEDILTDDILNSPEYIPLAESEMLMALEKRGKTYQELTENEQNIFKISIIENTRSKCCTYMSVYILNEAKKIDKADIKYEKYASVNDWKNQAQSYLSKSDNLLDSIVKDTSANAGEAYVVVVPW